MAAIFEKVFNYNPTEHTDKRINAFTSKDDLNAASLEADLDSLLGQKADANFQDRLNNIIQTHSMSSLFVHRNKIFGYFLKKIASYDKNRKIKILEKLLVALQEAKKNPSGNITEIEKINTEKIKLVNNMLLEAQNSQDNNYFLSLKPVINDCLEDLAQKKITKSREIEQENLKPVINNYLEDLSLQIDNSTLDKVNELSKSKINLNSSIKQQPINSNSFIKSNNALEYSFIGNNDSEYSFIEKKAPIKYSPPLSHFVTKLQENNLTVGDNFIQSAYVPDSDIKFIISNQEKNEYITALAESFTSTESSIEITSLSPPQRDDLKNKNSYYYVLIKGIESIAEKNKNREESDYIFITLLFGNAPTFLQSGVDFSIDDYINNLLADIKPEYKQFVRLILACYNPEFDCWNHSKIIVVDDNQIVIVGGINLFAEYNLNDNRPRDSAVKLESSKIAEAASNFIKRLLQEPNEKSYLYPIDPFQYNQKCFWNGKKITDEIPEKISKIIELQEDEQLMQQHPHNVLTVPTYGLKIKQIQASEVVALEIINNAKKDLYISQQSILFMYGGIIGEAFKGQYSNKIIKAIAEALERGVKVFILISADACKADNGNDYTGMPVSKLIEHIKYYYKDFDEKNLLIKNTANASGKNVPNHTKLVVADSDTDDAVMTIGSHNSYDKSHAEYTLAISGQGSVKRLLQEYWKPIWDMGISVYPHTDIIF